MALYHPNMMDTDLDEGDAPDALYYGEECTPYSEAGTKRGHLHPAAYHELVGIDLGVHHSVKWIACENVLNFQKLDHQHGMYTMWRRYAAVPQCTIKCAGVWRRRAPAHSQASQELHGQLKSCASGERQDHSRCGSGSTTTM